MPQPDNDNKPNFAPSEAPAAIPSTKEELSWYRRGIVDALTADSDDEVSETRALVGDDEAGTAPTNGSDPKP